MSQPKPWKNREIVDPSPVWYIGAKFPPKDGMYIIAQYQAMRYQAVVRETEVRSQEEESFGKVICQVHELQAWREDT
jgi:hypothetical protein